jgi:hypothetical protein
MPRNFKGMIFERNRAGLIRAFTKKDPSFHTCYTLLNMWLTASTKLSRANIIFGHKYVIQLRENELWHADLEKQKQVDRLDELLAKAKERLQKREETRTKEKTEAAPKIDRRFKPAEATTPTQDPMDIWLTMPTEKKT